MRHRSFIALAAGLAVLIFGAVAVYAYDASRSSTIADGISAGGVALGGMHPAKARATLEHALAAPLRRAVTVTYAGRRFTLSGDRAGARVDAATIADSALAASREGNMLTRSARELTGGSVNRAITVSVSWSRPAVRAFVAQVGREISSPPHDATLSFSGAGVGRVSSRDGHALDAPALTGLIEGRLVARGARSVEAPVRVVPAKVTTAQLASRYPTVITVDRGARELHLWKNLRPAKTYPIAVGMQGLETPAGLYHIQDKEVDPAWHVPLSSWAGSLAGQTIPGGAPDNPLKARWTGIFNGAGIHGTDAVDSLGSAASHGCIRMTIPDVEELYPQVPVGAPVFIQ